MNIFDPYYGLTERELKFLKKSWAETFGNTIFPLINEDRFSVLYSDNPATRPNNPVNVYMGLLMLREIFTQSDEESLGSLMFDLRYQYALHTTSFEEQPVSKNSLTNFRSAVSRYYEEHGIDLIQEEMESLAEKFSDLLNIDGKMIRMDSLMISSSCRKLSRLELVYSCLQRLIKKVSDAGNDKLKEKYKVYLEDDHRNDVIYRTRDNALDERLKALIKEAVEVHDLFAETDIKETDEFKLLSRMLDEQTRTVKGAVVLKPSKEISTDSLQNPTDPDATYRKKGSKSSTGYVANIVESFDDSNSIILQYDLQKNTYSDQQFSKDTIDKLGKQEEGLKAIVDGPYYSEGISKKAAGNNIDLVPGNLVGRTTGNEKSDYSGFNIDEKNHVILNCAAGIKPDDSKFKDGIYTAHFGKGYCDNCLHRANCPMVEQKKKYLLRVSEKKLHRTKIMKRMGTEEYKELTKKRAGIEGIPSVLRRIYGIDHMPVRGLIRSKIYLGLKISAINCKRLIKGLRDTSNKQPGIAALVHLLEVLSFQRPSSLYLTCY